ncbi:hypothetical protein CsSME_00023490 [Camellia sinensis var. sinensis]
MNKDGFLSCSCKKFEVKGIVCQHCLKVLREIINSKDLPADVKLHQSERYRSLMNMFRAIASRAAESEKTYHLSLAKGEELSVMVEDKLSVHTCGQVEITEFRNSSTNTCPQSDEVDCPIQAKGLKKRQATSKGRRRIKGGMEKSIAKKKRMQSKQGDGFCTPEGQYDPPVAIGNISSQGVYTPHGQSRPLFAMGSNYVEGVYTPQGQSRPPFAMGRSNYVEVIFHIGHGRAIYISQSQSQARPESQSQPSFAMGRTSVHHVMYPTYDGNNTPQSMPPDSMPLVYPTPTSLQELLRVLLTVIWMDIPGRLAPNDDVIIFLDFGWLVIREVGQVKFLGPQVQFNSTSSGLHLVEIQIFDPFPVGAPPHLKLSSRSSPLFLLCPIPWPLGKSRPLKIRPPEKRGNTPSPEPPSHDRPPPQPRPPGNPPPLVGEIRSTLIPPTQSEPPRSAISTSNRASPPPVTPKQTVKLRSPTVPS